MCIKDLSDRKYPFLLIEFLCKKPAHNFIKIVRLGRQEIHISIDRNKHFLYK